MPREVIVHKVRAFCDGDQGGNLAGVVQHPGLTPAEKQCIASEAGFSETVFISRSRRADVRMEFFTPVRQVPDCGHATLAALSWLRDQGVLAPGTVTREVDGVVGKVQLFEDRASFQLGCPGFKKLSSELSGSVAQSLGFRSGDFHGELPSVIADGSLPFCLVPVAGAASLEQIRPRRDDICFISSRLKIAGYLVFALESIKPGRDATSRMFAPAYGIHEESATGTASGSLGSYLYTYAGLEKDRFLLEQGFFMDPPSPSLLEVNLLLEKGHVAQVGVGGCCRVDGDLVIDLP